MFPFLLAYLKNWKLILGSVIVVAMLGMGVTIHFQHNKIIDLEVANQKMSQDIKVQNDAIKNLKELGEQMQKKVDDVAKENADLHVKLDKKIKDMKKKPIKNVTEFQKVWEDGLRGEL